MPDGPRYDDDFFAWTKCQADVLRTNDNRFDRDNVVEEIESLGNSQRDAARSQVRRILEHFVEARAALNDQISETLRSDLHATLARLYRDARRRAGLGLLELDETSAAEALPTACPYTLDDILRDDWCPK